MSDVIEFVREVGFPIALTIALCYTLYLIGKIGLNLLLEAWRAKDARLVELEQRITQVNNGQREALERRLDDGISVQKQTASSLDRVSSCLEKLGHAFAEFAGNRPCLADSDARRVVSEAEQDFTPDPDAVKVVQQRRERIKRTEDEQG